MKNRLSLLTGFTQWLYQGGTRQAMVCALVLALLFTSLFTGLQPVYGASVPSRIIGYYPEWGVYARNYQVMDIPADKLTHINYAFAKINESGEIAVWDTYAALEKFYTATDSWDVNEVRGTFKQLRLLKAKYPKVKILVSVGGWTGSGPFSTIASTKESREKFAASVVKFLQTYTFFDGVDIDWEYPVINGLQAGSPSDRDNYTLLLAELRRVLGTSYLLTSAVNAGPQGINAIDYHSVAPLVDWVNVMSYDFHGAWDTKTGHNSALYDNGDELNPAFNVHSAVENLKAAGVPTQKIVPGLAFYGRSVKAVDKAGINVPITGGAGPGSYEPGVLDYKDIADNYVNKNGYVTYWDDKARVPYLYNSKDKVFISYDNEQSIKEKVAYASALGGVMFWELSGDRGLLLAVINGSAVTTDTTGTTTDGTDNTGTTGGTDTTGTTGTTGTVTVDSVKSITSKWDTGYCADVKVTNKTGQTVDWKASLDIDGTVSSLWSATYTQTGRTLTAQGLDWNKTLQNGASVTFGFCAAVDKNTATTDTTSTTTGGSTTDLTTTLTIASDWQTGYCADVKITNKGTKAVDWKVTFTVDGKISSLWNGSYTQNGNKATVEGLSWNKTLQAGQAVTVGYCADR